MTQAAIDTLISQEYKHGFVTEIESDTIPVGLNEEVVRLISAKKNEPEFMLNWRLKRLSSLVNDDRTAMGACHYPPIDYQEISYYSAPKQKNGTEKFR